MFAAKAVCLYFILACVALCLLHVSPRFASTLIISSLTITHPKPKWCNHVTSNVILKRMSSFTILYEWFDTSHSSNQKKV